MSDWLTYSPISGHGNGIITITADTLSSLEDRVATIIVSNSQYSLSASTSVTQQGAQLTAITFENLTWVTDVPASGGTATKDNCSYTVIGQYSNGTTGDVTEYVTVSGSLDVPATTSTTRHEAGTLSLTATYSGLTSNNSVTIYQKPAFIPLTEYLTFEIENDGYICWHLTYGDESHSSETRTIEYSINNGSTWNSITSSQDFSTKINVNKGDRILFRGNNSSYGTSYIANSFSYSSAGFKISGNIMSLIQSSNFNTLTSFSDGNVFRSMFANCSGLTSAENLLLPATSLTSGCYFQMFAACSALTSAPELPATILANNCYQGMFISCRNLQKAPKLPSTKLAVGCYKHLFNGCRSLNYVNCLASDISAPDCTFYWVNGVAPTGTFVKASSMTSWTTDKNGIPSGWTVINDS